MLKEKVIELLKLFLKEATLDQISIYKGVSHENYKLSVEKNSITFIFTILPHQTIPPNFTLVLLPSKTEYSFHISKSECLELKNKFLEIQTQQFITLIDSVINELNTITIKL